MNTNEPLQTSDPREVSNDISYSVDLESAGIAPPAIPATAIRFCGGCGSPRDPADIECPNCAKRRVVTHSSPSEWMSDRSFIRTACWLYFSLLAVSIVSLAIVASTSEAMGVTALLIESGIMAAVTLGFCIRARRELVPILRKFPAPQWLILGTLCAIPTYVIALFAMEGMHRLIGLELIKFLPQFTGEGYGLGWAILAICIGPAVFEELGFRGVILSSLQRVLSNREAILVSALMFAILHLSPLSIPHLFLLGAAAGYLRVRTGSLLPGMLLHFTHNLLCVLAEQHGSFIPW